MRFFELDEDKVVQLNKPWIQLIPELRKLYTRDKGSPGDYDGRHKLRARRDYTMLYFYLDFNSPIRDWEEGERLKEACYYAGLDEAEVKRDEDLWAAARKYEELLINASPALSTHRALMKTKEKLDLYYATLDFTETDKMGKLLHDPISVANSAEKMDKLYASIKKFAKAAEEELKAERQQDPRHRPQGGERGQGAQVERAGHRPEFRAAPARRQEPRPALAHPPGHCRYGPAAR
jgi:hypothetical protein